MNALDASKWNVLCQLLELVSHFNKGTFTFRAHCIKLCRLIDKHLAKPHLICHFRRKFHNVFNKQTLRQKGQKRKERLYFNAVRGRMILYRATRDAFMYRSCYIIFLLTKIDSPVRKCKLYVKNQNCNVSLHPCIKLDPQTLYM